MTTSTFAFRNQGKNCCLGLEVLNQFTTIARRRIDFDSRDPESHLAKLVNFAKKYPGIFYDPHSLSPMPPQNLKPYLDQWVSGKSLEEIDFPETTETRTNLLRYITYALELWNYRDLGKL